MRLKSIRRKWILSLLMFLWGSGSLQSQKPYEKKELQKYIPYAESDRLLYPDVTLRVHLHLVYRSVESPQNYTLDSIELIKRQFDWINGYYKNLSPCTLPAQDGKKHFIPDSRIKFRLDTISVIVDSVAWDRIFIALSSYKIEIDSVKENKVYFSRNHFMRLNRSDSIRINGENYRKKRLFRNTNGAVLELYQSPSESAKELRYYQKRDVNCDRYIWEKYTQKDTTALHVFYTGSSLEGVAFGCGPKPYFLNVSNLTKGGDWANAQLIAHELGHTLGLRHTNYPQFDDLPKKDVFGFVMCDSKQTSNNIMGYNMCRNYLSPKQVGYVHYLYSSQPGRIRLTTANEYVDTNVINIWYDTTWNKAMVITGDIVVRKRQTLEVKNLVHLSQGSTIYLEKKAKLIIDGGELTNFFNTNWQGIIICKVAHKPHKKPKKPQKQAKIIIKNNGKITETVGLPKGRMLNK